MKHNDSNPEDAARDKQRDGDRVIISGDYQYRALTQGSPIQRFWHYSKILAIETLLPPHAGDRILDVGCGSGVISGFLGGAGAQVVGIDTNPDAVRFAEQTYSSPAVSFQVGLADQLPGQDGSVDKIFCLELIEHIFADQSKAMLDRFYQLLKPGGTVFLTTPNYRSLWPLIEWLMDHLKLAPHMAGHQHVERYTRKTLKELCRASGFVVQHLGAMCFVAPWVAPLSWRFAKTLAGMELSTRLTPGSLIICVLSKKG